MKTCEQFVSSLTRISLLGVMIAGCGGKTEVNRGPQSVETADEALRSQADVWQQRRKNDEKLAGVLSRLEASLAAAKIPGAGVAIVKNGQLYFAGGVGLRKPGGTEPVDAHTQFRVASLSKPFAAMTVLSLRDSGRIDFNESISTYAPAFKLLPPHDPAQIKVKHLLNHTAGLADFYQLSCKTEGPQSIEENFAALSNLTQRNPPGLLYSYSNQNFGVAALVAQKASGVGFRDLVQTEVFAKAKMVDSTYDPDTVKQRNNYATGISAGPQPFDSTFANCSFSDGAGGAFSSAHDLGKLAEQLLRGGGSVMPTSTFREMIGPQVSTQAPAYLGYGYGLFSTPYKGTLLVGHSGDFLGFHAAWYMLPAYGFAAAVIVNGDGYVPATAVVDAMNAYNTLPNLNPPDTRTPAAVWREYEGVYVDKIEPNAVPAGVELGAVQVELADDTLFFTLLDEKPQMRRPLVQTSRDSFSMTGGPGSLLSFTFHRNRAGQPDYLVDRVFGAAKRTAPGEALPDSNALSITEALGERSELSTHLSNITEEPFMPQSLLQDSR